MSNDVVIPSEIEQLRQAARADPNNPERLFHLGNAYLAAKDPEQASKSFHVAIRLKPDFFEAYCNLGVALRLRGELRGAIAAYRDALKLKPDEPQTLANLGVALAAAGQHEAAIESYRKAVAVAPKFALAYYNLGNSLRALSKWPAAIEAHQAAVRLKPDEPAFHSNLGLAYRGAGDIARAIACYDTAIQLKPTWAEPHWNRSLAYLLLGDFTRGWAEFEWRNQLKPPSSRPFEGPIWDGSPIDGKTILLHYEMGFGDSIQFARYAPMVAARGGKVILECQPELRDVLSTVAGVEQTLAQGQPLPAYDLHCSLMSLPPLLKQIPNRVPYVSADPARVEQWTSRIGQRKTRRRVGLVWAGNPTHQQDGERSIPLSMFAPLAGIDADFYSLQLGPAGQNLAAPAGMNLIDLTAGIKDFADTAALLSQLDLLIAVDTAAAHLAGAMGKPVWLLLMKVPDWRWMLNRSDSPWYPTMRLIRQTVCGKWDSVIAEAARSLA